MAVNYPNAVKVARMNAVTTAAGTTAVLEIGTAGMASILATIALGSPIAPTATGAGVLTLAGFPPQRHQRRQHRHRGGCAHPHRQRRHRHHHRADCGPVGR